VKLWGQRVALLGALSLFYLLYASGALWWARLALALFFLMIAPGYGVLMLLGRPQRSALQGSALAISLSPVTASFLGFLWSTLGTPPSTVALDEAALFGLFLFALMGRGKKGAEAGNLALSGESIDLRGRGKKGAEAPPRQRELSLSGWAIAALALATLALAAASHRAAPSVFGTGTESAFGALSPGKSRDPRGPSAWLGLLCQVIAAGSSAPSGVVFFFLGLMAYAALLLALGHWFGARGSAAAGTAALLALWSPWGALAALGAGWLAFEGARAPLPPLALAAAARPDWALALACLVLIVTIGAEEGEERRRSLLIALLAVGTVAFTPRAFPELLIFGLALLFSSWAGRKEVSVPAVIFPLSLLLLSPLFYLAVAGSGSLGGSVLSGPRAARALGALPFLALAAGHRRPARDLLVPSLLALLVFLLLPRSPGIGWEPAMVGLIGVGLATCGAPARGRPRWWDLAVGTAMAAQLAAAFALAVGRLPR